MHMLTRKPTAGLEAQLNDLVRIVSLTKRQARRSARDFGMAADTVAVADCDPGAEPAATGAEVGDMKRNATSAQPRDRVQEAREILSRRRLTS
jgi:hypothetical protein